MSLQVKIIIAVALLSTFYYLVKFNPFLIESHKDSIDSNLKIDFKKGDKIMPFASFDFEKGKWKVCVLINERVELSSKIPYGRYFYTENKNIIKKFSKIKFEYSGSDMATVENEIILYCNGKKVFRSAIILDENTEGLQNNINGYLEGEKGEMSKIISKFNSNLLPFVFI